MSFLGGPPSKYSSRGALEKSLPFFFFPHVEVWVRVLTVHFFPWELGRQRFTRPSQPHDWKFPPLLTLPLRRVLAANREEQRAIVPEKHPDLSSLELWTCVRVAKQHTTALVPPSGQIPHLPPKNGFVRARLESRKRVPFSW